jgi:hypothetical protein
MVDGSQHVIVFDGEEIGRHETILNRPVLFSLNSKHHAYGAQEGQMQFLVVDGQPLKHFEGLATVSAAFSPDSAHLAYVAMHGDRYFLVADPNTCLINEGPIIGAPLVWDDGCQLHTLVAKGRLVSLAHFELA